MQCCVCSIQKKHCRTRYKCSKCNKGLCADTCFMVYHIKSQIWDQPHTGKSRSCNHTFLIMHWYFFNAKYTVIQGPFAKYVELTLLFQVGTSWWCNDSLFFEVSALASNAFLTMLHPLLENMLQTNDHLEISCLGAPFSWLEKPRYCIQQDLNWIVFHLEKVDWWNPIRTSAVQSRSCPMWFLDFSNHEKGAPRQENLLFH